MADLHKIGLKLGEWHFRFPSKGRAMFLTPLSPLPPGKCTSGTYSALPAMNGPFPAELKFRENTGVVENIKHLMTGLKGNS